ncbi:hypothetical protein PAPYR_3140 [Paratrimastix pyriformis]|uniref:Uncharacterized protein n=1 Tax=Paratrimastix pyriformis TaxID=342808 RepID=A0ABQ8UNX4_9EUKA|nr:hypothetical protein PAPYR_3140 [Paratrimastix pyriformis]
MLDLVRMGPPLGLCLCQQVAPTPAGPPSSPPAPAIPVPNGRTPPSPIPRPPPIAAHAAASSPVTACPPSPGPPSAAPAPATAPGRSRSPTSNFRTPVVLVNIYLLHPAPSSPGLNRSPPSGLLFAGQSPATTTSPTTSPALTPALGPAGSLFLGASPSPSTAPPRPFHPQQAGRRSLSPLSPLTLASPGCGPSPVLQRRLEPPWRPPPVECPLGPCPLGLSCPTYQRALGLAEEEAAHRPEGLSFSFSPSSPSPPGGPFLAGAAGRDEALLASLPPEMEAHLRQWSHAPPPQHPTVPPLSSPLSPRCDDDGPDEGKAPSAAGGADAATPRADEGPSSRSGESEPATPTDFTMLELPPDHPPKQQQQQQQGIVTPRQAALAWRPPQEEEFPVAVFFPFCDTVVVYVPNQHLHLVDCSPEHELLDSLSLDAVDCIPTPVSQPTPPGLTAIPYPWPLLAGPPPDPAGPGSGKKGRPLYLLPLCIRPTGALAGREDSAPARPQPSRDPSLWTLLDPAVREQLPERPAPAEEALEAAMLAGSLGGRTEPPLPYDVLFMMDACHGCVHSFTFELRTCCTPSSTRSPACPAGAPGAVHLRDIRFIQELVVECCHRCPATLTVDVFKEIMLALSYYHMRRIRLPGPLLALLPMTTLARCPAVMAPASPFAAGPAALDEAVPEGACVLEMGIGARGLPSAQRIAPDMPRFNYAMFSSEAHQVAALFDLLGITMPAKLDAEPGVKDRLQLLGLYLRARDPSFEPTTIFVLELAHNLSCTQVMRWLVSGCRHMDPVGGPATPGRRPRPAPAAPIMAAPTATLGRYRELLPAGPPPPPRTPDAPREPPPATPAAALGGQHFPRSLLYTPAVGPVPMPREDSAPADGPPSVPVQALLGRERSFAELSLFLRLRSALELLGTPVPRALDRHMPSLATEAALPNTLVLQFVRRGLLAFDPDQCQAHAAHLPPAPQGPYGTLARRGPARPSFVPFALRLVERQEHPFALLAEQGPFQRFLLEQYSPDTPSVLEACPLPGPPASAPPTPMSPPPPRRLLFARSALVSPPRAILAPGGMFAASPTRRFFAASFASRLSMSPPQGLFLSPLAAGLVTPPRPFLSPRRRSLPSPGTSAPAAPPAPLLREQAGSAPPEPHPDLVRSPPGGGLSPPLLSPRPSVDPEEGDDEDDEGRREAARRQERDRLAARVVAGASASPNRGTDQGGLRPDELRRTSAFVPLTRYIEALGSLQPQPGQLRAHTFVLKNAGRYRWLLNFETFFSFFLRITGFPRTPTSIFWLTRIRPAALPSLAARADLEEYMATTCVIERKACAFLAEWLRAHCPPIGSATLLPLLGEAENIEITEDLRTVGQLRALHRGRPIFLRDPETRRRVHVQDSALLRPERIYFEDGLVLFPPFEIHTFRVECAGIINYSAKQHGGDFSLRKTMTHAANTAAVPFLGEIRHEPSPIEHACQDYYLVSVAIPCDDPGRLDQFMALVKGACSACDLSKCKHTTRPGMPDEYVTFSFPDHDFSRHKSLAASEPEASEGTTEDDSDGRETSGDSEAITPEAATSTPETATSTPETATSASGAATSASVYSLSDLGGNFAL